VRVLLTGATGLLGGEVLRQLAAQEHDVTVLVRPRNGHAAERVGRIDGGERARVVAGALDDSEALRRGCEAGDVVVHLAGAKPRDLESGRVRRQRELRTVNVAGTRNLAEASVKEGVRRLVLASSAAVYGYEDSPSRWPIREDSPLDGQMSYGRSKAAAEEVAREVAGDGRLELVVIRPSYIYAAKDGLLERIVESVASRPAWALASARGPTVQPIHVRDAAAAFLLAATARGVDGATVNLAGVEHITHQAFVRVICRSLGLAPPDEGSRDFSPSTLKYDIRRARAELGFEPRIVLQRGVPDALRSVDSYWAARRRIQTITARGAPDRRHVPWRVGGPIAAGSSWR
jgi:2-alkyl-3-oxoalkanoate reductase